MKVKEKMAYHPKTLLEIDNMADDEYLKGPYIIITEDKRLPYGDREALLNTAGLDKFHSLISEYRCNSLTLCFEGIAENRVIEHFSPLFAHLKAIKRMESLSLSGNGIFAPDYDYSQFEVFENVRRLTTTSIKIDADLTNFFPKLETWTNFDWRTNSIKLLNNRWPHLKQLHIDRLTGNLQPFLGANLAKLFLIRPSIPSFDVILPFRDLEILFLSGFRFKDDISKLSELPKLEQLCIERRSGVQGWETFKSNSLWRLHASRIPSKNILNNFPNLKKYDLDLIDDTQEQYYSNIELYDTPFTSIIEHEKVGE